MTSRILMWIVAGAFASAVASAAGAGPLPAEKRLFERLRVNVPVAGYWMHVGMWSLHYPVIGAYQEEAYLITINSDGYLDCRYHGEDVEEIMLFVATKAESGTGLIQTEILSCSGTMTFELPETITLHYGGSKRPTEATR